MVPQVKKESNSFCTSMHTQPPSAEVEYGNSTFQNFVFDIYPLILTVN